MKSKRNIALGNWEVRNEDLHKWDSWVLLIHFSFQSIAQYFFTADHTQSWLDWFLEGLVGKRGCPLRLRARARAHIWLATVGTGHWTRWANVLCSYHNSFLHFVPTSLVPGGVLFGAQSRITWEAVQGAAVGKNNYCKLPSNLFMEALLDPCPLHKRKRPNWWRDEYTYLHAAKMWCKRLFAIAVSK